MDICPFCNVPLMGATKYCPHCGKELSPPDEKSKRRFGLKAIASLILVMFLVFFISLLREESPQKVIEKQLNAIKEQQLTEAYFGYTSNEFQNATKLDDFKKFIKSFPLFGESHQTELEEIGDQGNLKVVKGVLRGPNQEILQVHYQLIKQDDKWKILNIKVIPAKDYEVKTLDTPEFSDKDLLKPLTDQLALIKEGSLKKAYTETTSKAFQEATPLKVFEKFIKNYPVFYKNRSADFYKLTFDNNIGLYSARLKAESGEIKEVEYSLIKEDGAWKILQIQIFDNP